MKPIQWITFGIGLAWLFSACQTQPTPPPVPPPTNSPAITNTRLAMPATWTPAPTTVPSATPTTPPTSTPVFVTITPEFTPNTPTPDPIRASLPQGATILRDQGWTLSTHPANLAAALPYQLPDGTYGIALVDELQSGVNISWSWQQETFAASTQWQLVRRLTRTLDDFLLLFLGQDMTGQWYLGAVTLPASGAQLVGMIPVQDPQTTFVTVTRIEGHPWEFWLLENGVLRLYQWQNSAASLLWEALDAPQDALTVWMDATSDITADGVPELWLRWWPWTAKDNWSTSIAWQQYFVSEPPGYRLIADLPPSLQHQDVDNDGVIEFLQAETPDQPRNWLVFDWNGQEFIFDRSLTYPAIPFPQIPKVSQLPPLGADLIFTQDDATYLWPKSGGELETLSAPPQNVACFAEAVTQEVVSWSPDCAYAVVKQPAPTEGYTLALLNVAGGGLVEIPNTFTYLAGYSTFDWNQASGFVLHARAGTSPGLYRVWLDTGLTENIFTLAALDADPFGVTDPFAYPDGSIGFAIQGTDERLYPPFGVYRRQPDGTWRMLADLPPMGSRDPAGAEYGTLQWSSDGGNFLFHAPYFGEAQPPYSVLLIGASDANLLLDINTVLGKAANFLWR